MSQPAAHDQELVYRHEPGLFALAVFISAIAWLLLILGTLGIALIYVFFFFLAYLFIQSAFISYLKGTGARITDRQFPDLHARLVHCSAVLGVDPIPEAYLIHADGVFNALATRFLGRNFVVLYSDVVDALAERPESLNFYIGHELGHIRRQHLLWSPWLWPATILPLLGAAYSRAREYTCDMHGVACCPGTEDSRRALAALAAGGTRWKSLDIDSYGQQAEATRGFWMSFHELISDYPWLVKRMLRLGTARDANVAPKRHSLAWVLALFVPHFGAGAGGLVVIAMLGIILAVAIPSYQDYVARAQVQEGILRASMARTCVEQYYAKHEDVPESSDDCGIAAAQEMAGKFVNDVAIGTGGSVTVTFRNAGTARTISGGTLVFEPMLDDNDKLFWDCSQSTIPSKLLPAECRR